MGCSFIWGCALSPSSLFKLGEKKCVCACGKVACPQNGLSSHILSCKAPGKCGHIKRHSCIQRKLLSLCKSAGYKAKLEQRVGVNDGSRTDVTIPDFTRRTGPPIHGIYPVEDVILHLDAAVVDNTCDAAIAGGSWNKPGKYADIRAKIKKAKYGPMLANRTPKCAFRPIVVETYGAMHVDFVDTLKDIARISTAKTFDGLEVSEADWKVSFGFTVSTYYQLMSVARLKAVVENIDFAANTVYLEHQAATSPGRGIPTAGHKSSVICNTRAQRGQNYARRMD